VVNLLPLKVPQLQSLIYSEMLMHGLPDISSCDEKACPLMNLEKTCIEEKCMWFIPDGTLPDALLRKWL